MSIARVFSAETTYSSIIDSTNLTNYSYFYQGEIITGAMLFTRHHLIHNKVPVAESAFNLCMDWNSQQTGKKMANCMDYYIWLERTLQGL
jgi:hypothetical protein